MSAKSPLVFVDGGFSELPPGDSIQGVSLGTLVAGNGVSGGGDLNTGSKDIFIELSPNPSGLVLTSTSIGLDGVDIVQANAALASGDLALVTASDAVASGNFAQSQANTALASGNAALYDALNFNGSSIIDIQASTDIPAYAPVGIGDDAKAQVVRAIVTNNSSPLTYGSSGVFEAASTFYCSIVYASTVNYFLIAYQDNGNSSYGTCVTGRLTNSSLTFGTPAVFNSAITDSVKASVNNTQQAGFIIYRDSAVSYYGRIIYVSIGSGVGFGSPVTFKSQSTSPLAVAVKDDGGDFIIMYRDSATSNYPGIIAGCVSGTNTFSFGASATSGSGTANGLATCSVPNSRDFLIAYSVSGIGYVRGISVSNLTLSFTTSAVLFESLVAVNTQILYDTEYSKFIVFYETNTFGYYRVGTYDGSSITFPSSAVQFISFDPDYLSVSYDSTFSCYGVAYTDPSNNGIATCGFFNGTTLSFGTPSTFEAGASYIASTYYPPENCILLAYRRTSDGYGVVRPVDPVYEYSYAPTVSSKFNYIGLSQNAVSSGSLVTVAPPKSLLSTPADYNVGSVYYLNPEGSGLSTSSTSPISWPSTSSWKPAAKAVSASGLLLLNPI